jgi:hypothetical protein
MTNMKLLTVLSFSYFFGAFDAQNYSTKFSRVLKNSELSNAISVVGNEVYATKMSTIPTINLISAEDSNKFRVKDFIDELLAKALPSSKFALRLESAAKLRAINKRRRLNNIFVLETFVEFLQLKRKITAENFKFNGHYPHSLLVFISGEIKEVQEIFQILWKLQIYNVNVMFEDENGEVLVQTFMPFNAQNCNETTPILINKFKDGKFINGTDKFFPNKMKNLHNCPIRIAISNDIDPFIFVKSENLSGRDIALANVLAESLNFSIYYTYIGPEGFLLENGSAIGTLKVLLDHKADLSISDWWLKVNRLKFFEASTSYISDNLILIVPPGCEFTALEKLIYPFAGLSWILVISCMIFGFAVIFFVQKRSTKVQDFVFGSGVRHPYLNLFVAFIGDSQNFLPRRNFARFLLMMFLMYSLIIRTLYQGSFFQLMQSNQRHSEVQSIDEMIKNDFKLYVIDGVTDVTQMLKTLENR